jgi:prevent-host-death family protein
MPANRKSISLSELRANAGRILRRVNKKREPVDVTYRGQVIAQIVPVMTAEETAANQRAALADIDRLAAEISWAWKPEGKTAAETVSEARR